MRVSQANILFQASMENISILGNNTEQTPPFIRQKGFKFNSTHLNGSLVVIQTCQRIKKGGFACTRTTYNGQMLPLWNGQIKMSINLLIFIGEIKVIKDNIIGLWYLGWLSWFCQSFRSLIDSPQSTHSQGTFIAMVNSHSHGLKDLKPSLGHDGNNSHINPRFKARNRCSCNKSCRYYSHLYSYQEDHRRPISSICDIRLLIIDIGKAFLKAIKNGIHLLVSNDILHTIKGFRQIYLS